MAKKHKMISPTNEDSSAYLQDQQVRERFTKSRGRQQQPTTDPETRFTITLDGGERMFDSGEDYMQLSDRNQWKSVNWHRQAQPNMHGRRFDEAAWPDMDEISPQALVVGEAVSGRSTALRRVNVPIANRIGQNPDLRLELEYKRKFRSDPRDLRSRLEMNRDRFGENLAQHSAPMLITSYVDSQNVARHQSVHDRISTPSDLLFDQTAHVPLRSRLGNRPFLNVNQTRPGRNLHGLAEPPTVLPLANDSFFSRPDMPQQRHKTSEEIMPPFRKSTPEFQLHRKSTGKVLEEPLKIRPQSSHSSEYSESRRKRLQNGCNLTDSRIERPEPVIQSPQQRVSPPVRRSERGRRESEVRSAGSRRAGKSPKRRSILSREKNRREEYQYVQRKENSERRRREREADRRRTDRIRHEELKRAYRSRDEECVREARRRADRPRYRRSRSRSRTRTSHRVSGYRAARRSSSFSPKRRALSPEYFDFPEKSRKHRYSGSAVNIRRSSSPGIHEGVLRSLSRSYSLEDDGERLNGIATSNRDRFYSPVESSSRSSHSHEPEYDNHREPHQNDRKWNNSPLANRSPNSGPHNLLNRTESIVSDDPCLDDVSVEELSRSSSGSVEEDSGRDHSNNQDETYEGNLPSTSTGKLSCQFDRLDSRIVGGKRQREESYLVMQDVYRENESGKREILAQKYNDEKRPESLLVFLKEDHSENYDFSSRKNSDPKQLESIDTKESLRKKVRLAPPISQKMESSFPTSPPLPTDNVNTGEASQNSKLNVEVPPMKNQHSVTGIQMFRSQRRNLVEVPRVESAEDLLAPTIASDSDSNQQRSFKMYDRRQAKCDTDIDGCCESGSAIALKWNLQPLKKDVKTYQKLSATDFPNEAREDDPRWLLICARRVRKSAENNLVVHEETKREPNRQRIVKMEDD